MALVDEPRLKAILADVEDASRQSMIGPSSMVRALLAVPDLCETLIQLRQALGVMLVNSDRDLWMGREQSWEECLRVYNATGDPAALVCSTCGKPATDPTLSGPAGQWCSPLCEVKFWEAFAEEGGDEENGNQGGRWRR